MATQKRRLNEKLQELKRNSILWFAPCLFLLHNVVSDDRKFDLVSVHLDEDIVTIQDPITNPPLNNKYFSLKQRILEIFVESEVSKLKRLLQGRDLTGKKPMEFLTHMRRLAPANGCEGFICTLFIAKLPMAVRPIISVWEEDDPNKLAKIGDKMLENSGSEPTSEMSTQTATAEQKQQNIEEVSNNSPSLTDVAAALHALSQ
ncbi:uncharacterized protein [Drosophila virilis]|uniref:uncharacterized protein n=1 Tax=Drosophila virilis TaxID=7244 RepID=UPI0038B27D97